MAITASQERSAAAAVAPSSPTRRAPASPALTVDQQREGRRRFYSEAAQQLARPAVGWRSPWDNEIGLLFAP